VAARVELQVAAGGKWVISDGISMGLTGKRRTWERKARSGEKKGKDVTNSTLYLRDIARWTGSSNLSLVQGTGSNGGGKQSRDAGIAIRQPGLDMSRIPTKQTTPGTCGPDVATQTWRRESQHQQGTSE